jgi:ribosomal protein L31E
LGKIVKLEVLIATPPTSKCEASVEVLREIVRRHPDEVHLVVFKRGIDFMPDGLRMKEYETEEDCVPKEASLQMRTLITKGRAVPTVVIDGEVFSTFNVPDLNELETRVDEILHIAG